MGGCQLEYEVEQAYIPESPEQREQRRQWDLLKDLGPFPL